MDQTAPAVDRFGALGVWVAGEHLEVPARDIAEIIRPPPLTRVPHAPAALLGLGNFRGAALPIVSLGRLLGRPHASLYPSSSTSSGPPEAAARVLVVQRASQVGCWVDAVTSLQPQTDACVDLDDLLAGFDTSQAEPAPGPVATSKPKVDGLASGAEPATRPVLVFSVAAQHYALPLGDIVEILKLPVDIVVLPDADPVMLGAARTRSGLLPLVCLHRLLGLPHRVPDAASGRVIVTRIGVVLTGLVADSISAIVHAPSTAFDPVPPVLTRGRGEARLDSICRLPQSGLAILLSPGGLFDQATTARLLGITAAPRIGPDRTEEATEHFVVFRLGEESYGLPAAAVTEIVRCPPTLTRVPHGPDFLAGVMTVHGAVVPVIDLHLRFGIPAGERRLVLILSVADRQAGILVDAVAPMLRATEAELAAAPAVLSGASPLFDRIAGVCRGGRMILLIAPQAVLDHAATDLLSSRGVPAPVAAPVPAMRA